MELKVSVIIPVYNVLPYLSEAIESVIFQTYRNLEIIVIDDGSTDGSGKLCDEYARRDNRIRVIHQANKGLSTARNVGLDLMTGDVVAFLDADDAFANDMIEEMVEAMQEQKADIVICDFSAHKTPDLMQPKPVKKKECQVLERDEMLQRIANGGVQSAPWNKLYVRKIWSDLRFPDGYVFEGTYTIFDIFTRAMRIAIINDKLVMHRDRPGSICNTWSLENFLDSQFAIDHFADFIRTRTPGLFSSDKLDEINKARVNGAMVSYIRYSHEYPEDEEGRQIIRDMLIKTKEKIGLENCCLPTRLGYYPSLYLPRLCHVFYYPYQIVKKYKRG